MLAALSKPQPATIPRLTPRFLSFFLQTARLKLRLEKRQRKSRHLDRLDQTPDSEEPETGDFLAGFAKRRREGKCAVWIRDCYEWLLLLPSVTTIMSRRRLLARVGQSRTQVRALRGDGARAPSAEADS